MSDEFDQDVGLVHLADQENNLGNVVEIDHSVGQDVVHSLLNLGENLRIFFHENTDVLLFVGGEVDGVFFQMEIGSEGGDNIHIGFVCV